MSGEHTGKEIEVVVQDVRMNLLRRDVNDPRARLPQEQQKKEEAFFKRLLPHAAQPGVDVHRRHDHDRLRILIHAPNRLPERNELGLQGVELIDLGLGIHG